MTEDNPTFLTSKNLENLSMDEIINKLNTSKEGLSSNEAEKKAIPIWKE